MKKKKRKPMPKEMPDALLAAADAAVAWWRSKRPIGWKLSAHLLNPSINTFSSAEGELARKAANWKCIQMYGKTIEQKFPQIR